MSTTPDRTAGEGDVPWSLENIRARIEFRAAELGLPYESMKIPRYGWKQNGPTVRFLTEIAVKLRWTLPEVLGIRRPDDLDPVVLTQAVKIVAETFARADMENCPLANAERTGALLHVAYGWVCAMARAKPELAYSDGALHFAALQLKMSLENPDPSKE